MTTATDAVALSAGEAAGGAFDVRRAREDFPALHQRVHGKPLVYLDNAATTQKPRAVLDAVRYFYEHDSSNVHRGVHALSERATKSFEDAREKVRNLLNAKHSEEIVFVRGTTEAINLVAQTYGRTHVGSGDEILITEMEHHSNIVPWQILCAEKGAHLKVVPVNDAGELIVDEFERLLTSKTRLVGMVHLSNALGTVNPVAQIVEMAHARGVPVLLDGAQATSHLAVDVQALGCDFYAFSGHKLYGPTGIGALYGRSELLEQMPPYQGGGDMILSVTFEKTEYNRPPFKFEAGTPNVAGAIGLGAAIDYLSGWGIETVAAYEDELLAYATKALSEVPGLRLIGTARDKAAVASFVLEGIHPHDLGTVLDRQGVAIRAGHHCTQPLMHRFGLSATARASFAFYNTTEEIDALIAAIGIARETLG